MTASAIGMDTTSPSSKKLPTSIPKVPATPSGPGVGGTSECVMTKPPASAMLSDTIDFFVSFESARASGERMTNPESQKIAIETTYPVTAIANSSRPLPKSLRNALAIRSAAPDASNICPIMTPKPMMIPIPPSVPPKPFVIVPAIAVGAIPPASPMIHDAIINAINTWTFVLRMSRISTKSPIPSPTSICAPEMSPILSSYKALFILYGSNPHNHPLIKFGEYFTARRIASIMLTALAFPVPAMSIAVP